MLLTTFSKALANALKGRLQYLIGNEPNIAASGLVRELIRQAAAQVEGQRFTERFLFGEWSDSSMPGN